MQFHHHGYVSNDPQIKPAAGFGIDRSAIIPETVDVLIVGAGPAGIMLAAQLSQFPTINTRLIERRPGRLEIGQADGIQARSVETFQAFGFAERIIAEAYRITHMNFWSPAPGKPDGIVRTNRTDDDPTGISEFPHLIVNQARVQDYFTEFMANSPSRITPDYGWEMTALTVADSGTHPVTVAMRGTGPDNLGEEKTVRATYVVGCDGARSLVRDAIGRKLIGGQSFHAWAVMDVLAVTDFPDIRIKCAIQSKAGSILLIPREGGHLFRMYVDLGEVSQDDKGKVRQTTVETAIATANAILSPYTLDVKHVGWYSVYEVGHRVTDKFDDVPAGSDREPHVFIAGDACHTHSAKAGQGMNVSMQDTFNLGWKLGYVLTGLSPAELLNSYSAERQVIAQNLIDFDRKWSTMMAMKPEEFADPKELGDFYMSTHDFPAGFMTEYQPSALTGDKAFQSLAAGFPIGKRFKSAIVGRVCDGNPLQLGHQHLADGRWRIYAFAGSDVSEMNGWADWLGSAPESPVVRFTPKGSDPDSVFDVKVIYQQDFAQIELAAVPAVFTPKIGPFQVNDMEKVFGSAPTDDIFDVRQIDRRAGAVVLVRPDQYVAAILPFTARQELADRFAGFMLDQ